MPKLGKTVASSIQWSVHWFSNILCSNVHCGKFSSSFQDDSILTICPGTHSYHGNEYYAYRIGTWVVPGRGASLDISTSHGCVPYVSPNKCPLSEKTFFSCCCCCACIRKIQFADKMRVRGRRAIYLPNNHNLKSNRLFRYSLTQMHTSYIIYHFIVSSPKILCYFSSSSSISAAVLFLVSLFVSTLMILARAHWIYLYMYLCGCSCESLHRALEVVYVYV